MDKQEFKSPQQAADAWGVTRATVNNWINKGCVPGVVRFGRKWRIPLETVQRIEEHGVQLPETNDA